MPDSASERTLSSEAASIVSGLAQLFLDVSTDDSAVIFSRRSTMRRSAVFLPTPGINVSRARLFVLIDWISSSAFMPESSAMPDPRTDATDGNEVNKQFAFARGLETIKLQRVFFYVRVDAKLNV